MHTPEYLNAVMDDREREIAIIRQAAEARSARRDRRRTARRLRPFLPARRPHTSALRG